MEKWECEYCLVQNTMKLELLCHKNKKYMSKCQPFPRKKPSLFPKWWCFECGRWVLPDKIHRPRFKEDFETLMKIAIK